MRITDSIQYFPGDIYNTSQLREVMSQDIERWVSMPQLFDTEECKDIFNDSFFERLGVKQRYLVVDPANPSQWWRKYQGTSPISNEGAKSYLRFMEGKEPLRTKDRLIVVSNVFDTTSPGIGVTVLACIAEQQPGFVSPSILPISGDGCSGFISAMHEADVWLRANPGSRVVIVSCEVSSPYFWSPSLLENLEQAMSSTSDRSIQLKLAHMIRGLFIQRFLFGDGCVAALCVDDKTEEAGIQIKGFHRWTNLNPMDRHLLKIIGIGTESGKFPSFGFFSQEIKELTARLLSDYLPRVRNVLDNLGRRPDAFAVHAGSGPILDLVQNSLSLTDIEIEPSRAVLRKYGNLNSATGAAILHLLQTSKQPSDTFCVFFGVGFTMQVANL